MEWWRLSYFVAIVAFVGYSTYSFFSGGLTWNFIPQGLALVAVGLLIYYKK